MTMSVIGVLFETSAACCGRGSLQEDPLVIPQIRSIAIVVFRNNIMNSISDTIRNVSLNMEPTPSALCLQAAFRSLHLIDATSVIIPVLFLLHSPESLGRGIDLSTQVCN